MGLGHALRSCLLLPMPNETINHIQGRPDAHSPTCSQPVEEGTGHRARGLDPSLAQNSGENTDILPCVTSHRAGDEPLPEPALITAGLL